MHHSRPNRRFVPQRIVSSHLRVRTPHSKTYVGRSTNSFSFRELLAVSIDWEEVIMSNGRIPSTPSSSGSSYCNCSHNGGESSSCKCESENEDENIVSFEKYWEHNNGQSDVNKEDVIKAAFNLKLDSSDSEESIKRSFSDEDNTDSVTEVTNNTTPSHVAIPPSDYDKPCLSGYFVPEKYTKAKVRTFRKAGERNFKFEASSAINRRKKQFEIDRQNMIMLRKLREVKPVVVLPR
ncbi:uncharacterized protein [Halyomorpha halys]|uniref:uncharacterized protein isoform X1 n=1 Tax=Halyomorpha halys TaxID=286706 RepID=UPI0006D4D4A2|nr:uncharacterized protein LOC106684865 isoform X1 [Halyomorpha halys]